MPRISDSGKFIIFPGHCALGCFKESSPNKEQMAPEENPSDRQRGPNCPHAQRSHSPQGRADAQQEGKFYEVGSQVQTNVDKLQAWPNRHFMTFSHKVILVTKITNPQSMKLFFFPLNSFCGLL